MPQNILKWLGGQVDVKVEIATDLSSPGAGVWDTGLWDDAVWSSDTLSFHDITQYLERVTIHRGQQRWDSRFEAGRAVFAFDNTLGIFSQEAGEVPWSSTFRPGRMIRVVVYPFANSEGGSDEFDPDFSVTRFTGRIDSSEDVFTEGNSKIITNIVAIDALGDLHDYNPPALVTATGVETTSERVITVLDRMSWPADQRDIQTGFHNMQTSFLAQTALEETQRCADAEGGALYADGDNNIVFKNRDWLIANSEEVLFEDDFSSALDPVEWPDTHDTSVSGGQLVVPGPGTDWAQSKSLSLGTNWEATIELVDAGMPETEPGGGAFKAIKFQVGSLAAGHIKLQVDTFTWPPVITASEREPSFGSTTTHASVAYDSEDHRWLRLARDGSTYSWFTAPSEDGPWTTFATASTLSGIGDVAYIEGNGSAGTDSLLDNLRVTEGWAYDRSRATTIQGYIGYDPEELSSDEIGTPTAQLTDTVKTPWELQRVRNDVQFARKDGTLQTVEDSTSQSLYGVKSYSRRDFHNNSDSEVLELADRNLAAYKDARPRLDPVTIVANDDPDNENLNVLFWDSQLGDLMAVKVETLHGWESEYEAHVIGLVDDISGNEWKLTFTLDDSIIAVLEALDDSV